MAERCSKKLWRYNAYYQCFRPGIVCRNGKWYCKQHDPGDPTEAQTRWVASILSYQIDPIQVLSETESTVLVKGGRRKRKVSEYEWICPTFEEAKACLVGYLEREVAKYARRLERAEHDLEAARKLEEPK